MTTIGRVLLAHGNTEWYGSDRSLVLLASALRGRGVDVQVSVPADGALADVLRAEGFTPVFLDPGAFRARAFDRAQLLRYLTIGLPRSVLATRRIARAVDVVHLNTSILLGGLVGARLARRATVLHVRESYAGHERSWRTYCRLISPFTSRIIATSADIAAEVEASGLGDRCTVVHNGISFAGIEPRADAVEGPAVTVARINEWKGHDVLIDAVARLRGRGIDVPVEIAGDALPGQHHLVAQLRAQASELDVAGLVTLLGYVDDVDALLRRAGLFVLPSSRPEPFGLALVDAMARGVPCIATDAGGPREIIDDGRTGLLVPMGDAGALADAIERLWCDEDLRWRLGTAAAADVRDRFSIDRTAAAVEAIYADLVTARS